MICENCGREFEGRPGKRFCSEKCRRVAERRRRVAKVKANRVPSIRKAKCEVCGKSFEQSGGGRKKLYCSRRCRSKVSGGTIRRNDLATRCRVCKQCGGTFLLTPKNKDFCSYICELKSIEKICPVCGKKFSPKSRVSLTCSPRCGKVKGGQTVYCYPEVTDKKERRSIRERERAKTDPGFRLGRDMRRNIWLAIRSNKAGRSWESLVGYTVDELKAHIESQFKEGMTWENRGEWHMDHIIPHSAFNYETAEDEDFKRCWALKNLQPLWAAENQSKSAKLCKPFQPSLIFD